MNRIVLLFCVLLSCSTHAQFSNNIWIFGDSAGVDFSNLNNPVPISSAMDGRGSCVSIADSLSNLLFYANTNQYSCVTTLVWNKQNQIMDNGDSLFGEAWYKELSIIPMPGHSNLFYLFSCSIIGCTLGYEGLYYSVIDMSANSGLGQVVQKNIRLLNFQVCDGIAAIKHGNGRDWWVFARQWDYQTTTHDYDEFHTFLITPDSILGPFSQHIGSFSNNGFYRIEPSKDGTKIMCLERTGILELFDFDRCTGFLNNPITIEQRRPLFQPYPSYWSCELSPDKTKLYVSSIYAGPNQDSTYLFQYDLNAADIEASRDTLDARKNPTYEGGMVELAPDGKIYYSIKYASPNTGSYPYQDSMYNATNQNLCVINVPDSLGSSCDFQPFSFYLGGKRTYVGLPNNPNYELPAWGGSICDTLGIWNHASSMGSTTQQGKLHVFYHSGWQTGFINAEGLKGRNYTLQISDISGKNIFSENGCLSPPSGAGGLYYTKDFHCEKLSSGIYLVLFETEKERLVKKMVIE